MGKLIFRLVAAFVVVALLITAGAVFLVRRQGVPANFWQTYRTASVSFDEFGVPTIVGQSWDEVVKAQGFVTAAERLWQMDLFRRRASGQLAEWFGTDALEFDLSRQREGRLKIAEEAVEKLPAQERKYCDLYAEGVNAFIQDFSGKWGIEYTLTRQSPQPWRCADSLLVVLLMTDQLSESYQRELDQGPWLAKLPPEWVQFLYPQDHPWNVPLFGTPTQKMPPLPDREAYLPRQPLKPEENHGLLSKPNRWMVGSNNWAYRGSKGYYLSNDPHLGQSVPGIWFLARLKLAKDRWVVGATIPGLPGVILGMNPAFAWAMTNIAEDVDDLIEEKLSEDGKSYQVGGTPEAPEWRPLETYDVEVKVKGLEPVTLTVKSTHRGPLVQEEYMGERRNFSRQFLPLKPGLLRLPSLAMADSKSWDEFMAAIDSMTVPAQNVVIVDRAGNVGYRSSGTGVLRHAPGFAPGKAADLQWDGLAAAKDRPRKLLVNDGIDPLPVYIATANERVWVDKFGHYWDADDRKGRIAEYLKSSPDYVLSDMAALQLDTQATFSKLLLEWIIKKTSRRDDIANNLKASWAAWKGTIRENPLIFAQAQVAEESMRKLLIGRVFSQYFVGDTHTSVDKYSWGMDHAWFMALLEQANATKAFGTNDVEVADYLIQQVLNRTDLKPHQEGNRWAAQHPFVGRIPLIGSFFEVEAPLQLGAADVPMVERPRFGASVRFLWELSNPQASRWVIPVGQSGHIKSKWYQGFRQMWIKGQNTGVFPDSDQWAFRDPSTLKAY